ncbi:hypothetical protein J2129_000972 [Methanofollis sp. W23]|nr:hypothetical protein [Methanofollis sp. W23]MBP2145518.1 hypothetical protein [Methanofollis sp. W23]
MVVDIPVQAGCGGAGWTDRSGVSKTIFYTVRPPVYLDEWID